MRTNEYVMSSLVSFKTIYFWIYIKETIWHIKEDKQLHYYYIVYYFVFLYWQIKWKKTYALFC